MKYKLPHSVQVVLFAEESGKREYLLLKRLESFGGFWQSVTGSLEEGEDHRCAAVREVREETGIELSAHQLIDLGMVNEFEISPRWLSKYASGVTRNREVCFASCVMKQEIHIDRLEHDLYQWAGYEIALELLFWESNKLALTAANEIDVSCPEKESGSRVKKEIKPAGSE